MTARRALWFIIIVSAGLRLVWAASIGLGHDEAYHYLFTTHPSLSYFDHPPMLAVVESLGTTLLGSSSTLALRLGFIVLFAGSTWLLGRITERCFGERAAVFAAFAMNVSAYHTAAAGTFALPDGPLLFFWLLTIDRMAIALEDPRRIGRWVLVGLAWGLALLSKYHAIFLPAGLLLHLIWTPPARRILRMPGPYLATVVGVVVFSPVLIWNASHGWASFVFQGGRAVAGAGFKPVSLIASFLGQAAYLLPWIWIALVIAMVASVRRLIRHEATEPERLLLSQAVTPLVLFSIVASVKEVLPHWTLIGYVSVYPLLGRLWSERFPAGQARSRRRLAFMAALPIGLAAIMVAQYRVGFIPLDRLLGPKADVAKIDPTTQLFGWEQVAEGLKQRGFLDRADTFLFTGIWYNSGHLGYATRGSGVPVVCYNPNDSRGFAFWSRPEEWVGHDGILVSIDDRPGEPRGYAPWFDRIEPAGEFPIVRAGKAVRQVRLFRCVRQLRPFPYDYGGRVGNAGRPDVPARVAGGRDLR